MGRLFTEFSRRNVFRVAAAYLVVGWLLLQLALALEDALNLPDWFAGVAAALLILGLPVALVLAWAFEVSPEGIRRTADVATDAPPARPGRKLDSAIAAGLVAVIGLIAADFMRGGASEPASEAQAAQAASESDPASTRPGPARAAPPDKSVAVLPFLALSSGPDDGYFADGLTEEIINALTTLPDLLVTARTSAFHFKGTNTPIPEIARTLGVAHVVEGSVRRAGEQVRITAQLIRASDGFHLWSETYDRPALARIWAGSPGAVEAAQAHFTQMRRLIGPHHWFDQYEIFVLASADRLDDAKQILAASTTFTVSERRFLALMLAAATDDREAIATLRPMVEVEADFNGVRRLMVAAWFGENDSAGKIGRRIDSMPFGYMALLEATELCLCGSPFPLESAPSFARRLKQGNLPWPPISPIDWPLKDWP